MSSKPVPKKAEPSDEPTPAEAAKIPAARRTTLLGVQEAVETAADALVRAQTASQRAQAEVALAQAALTEASADRDLALRMALREARLSGETHAINIDTQTGEVEFRKREDKPKG